MSLKSSFSPPNAPKRSALVPKLSNPTLPFGAVLEARESAGGLRRSWWAQHPGDKPRQCWGVTATPGGDEQPRSSAWLRQWVHRGLGLQELVVFTRILWPRSPSPLLVPALTTVELDPSAPGSTAQLDGAVGMARATVLGVGCRPSCVCCHFR